MISKVRVAVLCTSVLCAAGVAQGSAGARHGPPVDGTWKANGTVKVARHIADISVGDRLSVRWRIKSSCSGACKTTLNYGKITIPLHGHGKSWKGAIHHVVFPCTHHGTAIGSLAFKLHVTRFVKHKKQRVADGLAGTGIQKGKGCANIKEVVDFKATRLAF